MKIEIPKEVIHKIRYLCREIHREEWSGVLFYEVKGSIRLPNKMRIILRDIFLMDKGTGGATGFKWDEEIVNYRMDHEESDNWLVGHIHSHHNMGVFFSGVDMSELNDNAPKHNIYLSIIVNNNLDITGKIVMYAESMEIKVKRRYMCKDETGKDFIMELSDATFKPPDGMIIYECEMLYDKPKIEVGEDFIRRIEVVLESKEKKKTTTTWQGGGYSYPSYKPPSTTTVPTTVPYLEELPKGTVNEMSKLQLLEAFGGYCLRLGTFVEDDNINDALNDIAVSNINESAIAYVIERQYMRMFGRFFDEMGSTARVAIFDVALQHIITELLKTDDPAEADLHEAGTLIDAFLAIQRLSDVDTKTIVDYEQKT